MIDKLDTQGGHVAVLFVLILLGMLGCWLKIDGARDIVTLSLGGLLVEIAVVRK